MSTSELLLWQVLSTPATGHLLTTSSWSLKCVGMDSSLCALCVHSLLYCCDCTCIHNTIPSSHKLVEQTVYDLSLCKPALCNVLQNSIPVPFWDWVPMMYIWRLVHIFIYCQAPGDMKHIQHWIWCFRNASRSQKALDELECEMNC